MNINKIKLSGTTYSIQDENATKTVELTQAQYDALPATAKTSNTLFIITDATAGDLSNYYTKSETSGATQISTALASKQDTLVSGTNIKTINNESILGSGNITIEGGGGAIDQSLDSGSTNAVANSAVSAALNKNFMFLRRVDAKRTFDNHPTGTIQLNWQNPYNGSTGMIQDIFDLMKINNIPLIADNISGIYNLNLVETSAITTSVNSSSTDAQVPSAKAVYDALQEGGSSITVDTALDSGSTNPVENKAIYNKIDEVEQVTAAALNNINDRISEDEEVTAAGLNALNDNFGGLKLVKLSQAEYSALAVKDSQTLYIIVG